MRYLETIYFEDEYSEQAYPQRLCNYLAQEHFYLLEDKKKIFKGNLLDVGSGKGNHVVGFHRLGYTVSGLDKRDECVDVLRTMNILATIKKSDIEHDRFPFDDNTFDWIFSKSALEHVRNIDNFMHETLRVLKAGGRVVFMTPSWESQYKFFWDDYTHVTPFTRKSLQNAMKINGFENVTCDFFLQLPLVWKYPFFKLATQCISFMFPDTFKWRNREQSKARKWLRFSKEKMLLAVGEKKI
jgi:2-polyprenyl-3-methyl-5-hydroxy-6-metoxy-1,4-benzoquinol methylase